MEIRTLKTFQVVAEELNLTKAAIKLNYSQPTVTKHIKSLEYEFGTTLLEKKKGRYILTLAGEKLYERATKILREVTLAKKILPEHGDLISMNLQGHDYYIFHYFIPMINQFYAKFPNVSFQLAGGNNETTLRKLLRNEVDLGIITGNIATSELVYEQIGTESTALCISSKRYKYQENLDYYLEKFPVVIDQSETYTYDHFFQHSLTPPTIIDCSSDEVVQEAILTQQMIGIVRTGRLERYINSGEIKIIEKLTKNEPINIVMNKNRVNNKYINTLFNTIYLQFQEKQIHPDRLTWIQTYNS